MADSPAKTSLERLKELVEAQDQAAASWEAMLPTLRAQASASSAVLSELAEKPANAPPSPGVDVLFVFPERDDVIGSVMPRLANAFAEELPSGTPDVVWDPPGSAQVGRVHLDLPDAGGKPAEQRVRAVLDGLPEIHVDYSEPIDLIVVTPSATDWYWGQDEGQGIAMRWVGGRTIVNRGGNVYDVSAADAPDRTIRVTCDVDGWHCADHDEADEDDPCAEIALVLYATDGGKPVTKAQVRLVKSVERRQAAGG